MPVEAVVIEEFPDVRLVAGDALKLLDERIGSTELPSATVDLALNVADLSLVIGIGQWYRPPSSCWDYRSVDR